MDFAKKFNVITPRTHSKWFELEDARFLIAPANNTAAQRKVWETLTFEEAIKAESGDPTVWTARCKSAAEVVDLMNSLLVGTVLLDWEGVLFEGESVPFSHDKAVEFLRLGEFKNWVEAKSQELVEAETADKELVKKS